MEISSIFWSKLLFNFKIYIKKISISNYTKIALNLSRSRDIRNDKKYFIVIERGGFCDRKLIGIRSPLKQNLNADLEKFKKNSCEFARDKFRWQNLPRIC